MKRIKNLNVPIMNKLQHLERAIWAVMGFCAGYILCMYFNAPVLSSTALVVRRIWE